VCPKFRTLRQELKHDLMPIPTTHSDARLGNNGVILIKRDIDERGET